MIQVICFSKARPLQLHGYLTSVYEQWSGDFTVSVLARIEPPYQGAYAEVAAEFFERGVVILPERDFASDLDALIEEDTEFTCFGCDDAVYVAPVDTNQVGSVFDKLNPLGVSLRLGENVLSDMFGADLYQPDFTDWYEWRCWQFREGVGDWGYPWEVLGTVYRTEFVKSVVSTLNAGSPSQLEERGSHVWGEHTDRHRMACGSTSRLVVPTVNVVQQEFPNGIKGTKALEPEFLLDCWNNGLRLDTQHYVGMQPESWRVPEFYLRRAA